MQLEKVSVSLEGEDRSGSCLREGGLVGLLEAPPGSPEDLGEELSLSEEQVAKSPRDRKRPEEVGKLWIQDLFPEPFTKQEAPLLSAGGANLSLARKREQVLLLARLGFAHDTGEAMNDITAREKVEELFLGIRPPGAVVFLEPL